MKLYKTDERPTRFATYITRYLTNHGADRANFENEEADSTIFEGVEDVAIEELHADLVTIATRAYGFADAYNMLNV